MMVEAVLAAFAGWRIASLLVTEDGPWDVFERLRIRTGLPPTGQAGEIPRGLGSVLSCLWCCSVWTTAGTFAVAHWVSPVPIALVAAMGMAIAIHEYVDN